MYQITVTYHVTPVKKAELSTVWGNRSPHTLLIGMEGHAVPVWKNLTVQPET